MSNCQNPTDDNRFRRVSGAESIQLQPEEPAVAQWQVSGTDELVAHLLGLVGAPEGRPAIIAVDGRGGSGKTTSPARRPSTLTTSSGTSRSTTGTICSSTP